MARIKYNIRAEQRSDLMKPQECYQCSTHHFRDLMKPQECFGEWLVMGDTDTQVQESEPNTVDTKDHTHLTLILLNNEATRGPPTIVSDCVNFLYVYQIVYCKKRRR